MIREDRRGPLGASLSIAVLALFLAAAPQVFADEIEGIITTLDGVDMVVSDHTGMQITIRLTDSTRVVAAGGVFGLWRTELAVTDLINGLPVTVEIVVNGGTIEATEVVFKAIDLKSARQVGAGAAP